MSVKKILFAALLAAAGMAMSSTSMAQFDGLYVGGGFSRFTATETAIDTATNSSLTFGGDEHQGGFNGFVGLGGSVGPLHLAVEASYANQIGEIKARFGGVEVIDGVEEAAAISLLPGIKFGNTGLIFARFGATQAKLKAADGSFSQKHDGTLIGIGVKQALGPHGAIVVEYQSYDFDEKAGIQPRASGVLVGLQFSTHSDASPGFAGRGTEPGFYIGGSMTQMEADGDCPAGFTCDFKDTGFKVFGGVRLARYFALEGFYGNWGEITVGQGAASAKVEASTFGVAALGILPLGEKFELFGKVGMGSTELKATASGGGASASASESGSDVLYGVGAAFNFTRNFGLRAEYERLNDSEVNIVSVGLQYRF